MYTIISFIIIFGLLVFVHELGHFTVAKLSGICVREFALGFGPKLIAFERGETKYAIRMIPLGGYVRMDGEDEETSDPRGFNNAKIPNRLGVLFAGPLMNFALAVVLFSIIGFVVGVPSTSVGSVVEDYPAMEAGIIVGDEIVEISGIEVKEWEDVPELISNSTGEVDLVVIRDGQEINFTLTPELIEEENRKVVGITPGLKKDPIKSFSFGAKTTYSITKQMIMFLAQIPSRGVSDGDLIGPAGIVGLVSDATKTKTAVIDLMGLTGLLSINLGIFNLLPIPALDGGRILFIFIEIIMGRKLDKEKEGFIHFVGFVLLMSLMVLLLWKDISRMFFQ